MPITENLLPLEEIAQGLPQPVHYSTLWRWCRQGLHGCRLRYWRQGRRILTSFKAVEQFMRDLAEQDPLITPARCSAPAAAASPPHRPKGDSPETLQQAEQYLAQHWGM